MNKEGRSERTRSKLGGEQVAKQIAHLFSELLRITRTTNNNGQANQSLPPCCVGKQASKRADRQVLRSLARSVS